MEDFKKPVNSHNIAFGLLEEGLWPPKCTALCGNGMSSYYHRKILVRTVMVIFKDMFFYSKKKNVSHLSIQSESINTTVGPQLMCPIVLPKIRFIFKTDWNELELKLNYCNSINNPLEIALRKKEKAWELHDEVAKATYSAKIAICILSLRMVFMSSFKKPNRLQFVEGSTLLRWKKIEWMEMSLTRYIKMFVDEIACL